MKVITTTIDLQTKGDETSNLDNNYNNKLSKNQRRKRNKRLQKQKHYF